LLYYEKKFKLEGYDLIVGVDEVGRGPLAGPVVAAAVLLKTDNFKERIDDSKKLSSAQREKAFFEIINNSIYGVGIVNEKVIDRVNIFQATRIAMENAIIELIDKLAIDDAAKRIHILIDGTVKPQTRFSYTNIIKGDSKSQSIASASIIAKVIRDRIMHLYDKVFPEYGFAAHKGYGTNNHRLAIREFGQSLIHRKSFSCV
jgi:ribonuclease HII